LIFSAAFIVTALLNVVIGPVMDRMGRKRALQLVLLAAGMSSGLTAFVTGRHGLNGIYLAVDKLNRAGQCRNRAET
jgi:MFS family permease